MPRVDVRLPFTPREWQRAILKDDTPRQVIIVHRRAGKSKVLFWRIVRHLFRIRRQHPVPSAVSVLPENVQWTRTKLWDEYVRDTQALWQAFYPGRKPPQDAILKQEKRLMLPNGSIIQCGGADNDAWRGGGADISIVDEYDDTNPDLVPLILEPMAADRDGAIILSGTPKGFGLLKNAYHKAGGEPDWSRTLLTYQDTNVLKPTAIDRLRRELSEAQFAQELECNMDIASEQSIFGKFMIQAIDAGRVTSVDPTPGVPVETWWDIGRRDPTAIWFAQRIGPNVLLIDYHEDTGKPAEHYVNVVKQKAAERGWTLYDDILPHDGAHHEWMSVDNRTVALQKLGLNSRTVPQTSLDLQIDAARRFIPRCMFDIRHCERGIEALKAYRYAWDSERACPSSQPIHDWSSHAASAFMTGAIAPPREYNLANVDYMGHNAHDLGEPITDDVLGRF